MRETTCHYFTTILLILIFSSTYAMDCDKNDYKALLQIKQDLGNPPDLSSWIPNTNCCIWNTVHCSETGRVHYILFYNINVNASLSSVFGELSALDTLNLQNMPGLTGSIPSSFAKLSNLELLLIQNTSISGTIPDFLPPANLSALILSQNKLHGQIPKVFSEFPNLRYVDFSYNMLTGSIPPGLLHAEFQFLYLSNNQLSGEIPKSYGQGDVNTLDFSHNMLTGDPSFLFSIDKHTDTIDLSWNRFEFDMTKTMFPYMLTHLDLSHNKIRGSVSKSLKDLYHLKYLNLSYNELCGEIPSGRAMLNYSASSYLHNKCLCGTPLPAC